MTRTAEPLAAGAPDLAGRGSKGVAAALAATAPELAGRGAKRAATALAALALALLALAGCGGSPARTGSTVAGRWVDPRGSGTLQRGPGEPLVDRTDLAPRSQPGRTLAVFAQIADAHVRDEESPARVPFLDRLGPPFNSTFRPQEALSAQVLDGIVRSLRAVRPQAVVETGDLIDNDQADELQTAVSVLRGGRVAPDSGARGYDGVQSASDPDPAYYRPAVDAPREPGLLTRAQRPFRSPGLGAPWYPALGNHDVLVQGEIGATPRTRAIAVGDRRGTGLDPGIQVPSSDAAAVPGLIDRLLARGLPGPFVHTPPDPDRRELTAAAVVARLRAASAAGGAGAQLSYTFDIGPSVRGIVLDTIRRDHGSRGVLPPEEAAWLRAQLARAGRRRVIVFSHQPLTSFPEGARALALLDRDRRVLATVAGDTHHNQIRARRAPAGGYWTITTSSLADYPQQARAFRLVQGAHGRVALETWMVDASGVPLADTARELAYLDVQGGRPNGFAGHRLDRNVRLWR